MDSKLHYPAKTHAVHEMGANVQCSFSAAQLESSEHLIERYETEILSFEEQVALLLEENKSKEDLLKQSQSALAELGESSRSF